MKINDIVSSAYTDLLKNVKNNNVIAEGKTASDLLNDIILQSLRHFKNKDVSWEIGYKYLKDNFFLELYFSPKRKSKDILLINDVVKTIDRQNIMNWGTEE